MDAALPLIAFKAFRNPCATLVRCGEDLRCRDRRRVGRAAGHNLDGRQLPFGHARLNLRRRLCNQAVEILNLAARLPERLAAHALRGFGGVVDEAPGGLVEAESPVQAGELTLHTA